MNIYAISCVLLIFFGNCFISALHRTQEYEYYIPSITRILQKDVIDIAIIFQTWDYMDLLLRSMIFPFYLLRFKEIEMRYNVNCNIFVFWDSWYGGDIQNGKLRQLNIDVILAPGGVGAFYTPKTYRDILKDFIEKGGGFFGLCGDYTLGTIGYINLSDEMHDLLDRLFHYKKITPPLGLVNVLVDAGPFSEHFRPIFTHNNLYVLPFLLRLLSSDAEVCIPNTYLPFAQEFQGKTVHMMTGMPPMVGTEMIESLSSYSVLGRFGESRSPYNSTSFTGKYAIIASEYGDGKIILSAVHPEVSIGRMKTHRWFHNAILWLADIEMIQEIC